MRMLLTLFVSTLLATPLQAQDQSITRTDAKGNRTTITWGPAATPPAQAEPDFAMLDRNGDGALSLDETAPHRLLHSDFDFADSNRDGSLSPRELQRWIESDG